MTRIAVTRIAVTRIAVIGLDPARLARLWDTRIDDGGNPVHGFTATGDRQPLRCCLRDADPGEEIAVVAANPYPWRGPYAEVGPVFVHLQDCGGRDGTGLPPQFRARPQVLRPYDQEHRIAYDRIRSVPGDGSIVDELQDLLAFEDIDVVQARNPGPGCYSFTARTAGLGD